MNCVTNKTRLAEKKKKLIRRQNESNRIKNRTKDGKKE